MFTGIVEAMATLEKKQMNQSNIDFWFSSPFTAELKIDQSVAHNGVCLTVVEIQNQNYRVTAINETLQKTGNIMGGKILFFQIDWLSSLEIKESKDIDMYKSLFSYYFQKK